MTKSTLERMTWDRSSSQAPLRSRARALRTAALAAGLLVAAFGVATPAADASPTSMVDLGSASTYAVLSGASVANTAGAGPPHTTLRGDLGVVANAPPTGFPPGIVTGGVNVGNAAAAQAGSDALAAYTEASTRTGGTLLDGVLAGATIAPGLYKTTGAASNTTTLTLDGGGDSNAVFVFQVNGALTTAAGSHVVLVNGARASRVFWQVKGAGTIGAGATFAGTIMALDTVAVGNGSVVNGRLFALGGALTLDADDVYSVPPVVTIAGGQNAFTTDTTPTISGTTDVEAPGVVTVTIDARTLTATPTGGSWSVTSPILANNTYPVVASVTDAAGNPGSATQALTVDTVPPVVTLDGGAFVTTNDPTPTIAGTSDVAPGTIVHVGVGAATLSALVQLDGTWNVTPPRLSDGVRSVTAAVSDPAGNPGTASQTVTVDTTPPVVTITGGANALTNDATPAITGSAAVSSGTTVHVTLADETVTGVVQNDGTWSVTPSELADGPHRVIVDASDDAGNQASFTQTLTVDTVSPTVTIDGGASATTSDSAPTITGTSNAAPGTTVTVSIASQTITALLQSNGTWNATPALIGAGTWVVSVSAPDPAGNVGSARQTLTVDPGAAGRTLTVAPGAAGPPLTLDPGGASPSGATGPPATSPIGHLSPAPDRRSSFNGTTNTTITTVHTQKIKGSSLSISTRVTAPAGGGVIATARGTVRIAGSRWAVTLTHMTRALAARHSATLVLTPRGSRKIARAAFAKLRTAARSGRKVTATVTIHLADAAGDTRVVRRTVSIT